MVNRAQTTSYKREKQFEEHGLRVHPGPGYQPILALHEVKQYEEELVALGLRLVVEVEVRLESGGILRGENQAENGEYLFDSTY